MFKVLAHSLSVLMLAGIPLALAQEADPADADVAAPTEDTPRAGTGAAEADDGLEEIVLRREDEADEEPYLDELDEPIVDNESERWGGGVALTGRALRLVECTIHGNLASENGSGVYALYSAGTQTNNRVTFAPGGPYRLTAAIVIRD